MLVVGVVQAVEDDEMYELLSRKHLSVGDPVVADRDPEHVAPLRSSTPHSTQLSPAMIT